MALIETKRANSAGIYLLKFYINGIETPVIVDDYLPVMGGTNDPAFAYSRDGELWASLLEKGWAKLHGTYARLEAGLPCFAYNHISGAPAESMLHSQVEDREEFWKYLKMCDQRNFSMISSSCGENEQVDEYGVVAGHAYSLLEIIEFEHRGEDVRLLRLRNPWA